MTVQLISYQCKKERRGGEETTIVGFSWGFVMSSFICFICMRPILCNVNHYILLFPLPHIMSRQVIVLVPTRVGTSSGNILGGTESAPRNKVIYCILFRNITVILKPWKMVNNVNLHSGNFFQSLKNHNKAPMQSPHSVTLKLIPVSACQLKIFASVCSCVGPSPTEA